MRSQELCRVNVYWKEKQNTTLPFYKYVHELILVYTSYKTKD